MQAEEAGLEVMSGCFAVVGFLFFSMGAIIVRSLRARRNGPAYDRLIHLMIDFVADTNRSLEAVTQIETLLMAAFIRDGEYEELTAAVASFTPGGTYPFRDEAWLAETFRAFLRKRGVSLPDYGPDQPGVWPPPPKY